MAKTIAVTGKGGVGKTSMSALIVKLLVENKPGAKILAIDADPAIGLSTALGVEVGKTIDDIRKNVIDAAMNGERDSKLSILTNLDYEVFDAMVEKDGFAFLAVGRPESEGCYCKINTYLKHIIKEISDKFDYVVIDGEAGIEQINRRVMETVTHLLLVSDASKKGINVIKTIAEVAKDLVAYEEIGAIINRIQDENVKELVDIDGLCQYSFVSEDKNISYTDIKGESLLNIENDLSVKELKSALEKFRIL
ncbi:ATP-binding protein [Tepidibacter sp. Z1-5]|uniref:ATP-binding protein n=1 Tax=Tepidibacter sp. Z1-5 TaxID=3134138 RepID=UPI0030BB9E3E